MRNAVQYHASCQTHSQNFSIVDRKLCIDGQSILDVGTGTGVLPRNMYQYGTKWRATDISGNQIEQAKILSKDMDIDYYVVPTEDISFSDNSLDVITACQCFWYFKHEIVMPKFYRMLKKRERFLFYIWHGFHLRIKLREQVKNLC